MIWKTKDYYLDILLRGLERAKGFEKNIPEWLSFDKFANLWTVRFPRRVYAILCFFCHATVDVCTPSNLFSHGSDPGRHRELMQLSYGYWNFNDTGDHSRNSLAIDFLTVGELFQNNHR